MKEIPGVVSQGETLSALEENIRDAYQLVTEDEQKIRFKLKAIEWTHAQ